MIVIPAPSAPHIPIAVSAIDDIVVTVAVSIPKCPRPTIKEAVKDVVRDWCQTTWDSTRRFMLSGKVADVWDIDFSGMLPGMDIFCVAGLWTGGRKVPVRDYGGAGFVGYRVVGDHLFLFPVNGSSYEVEVVLQPQSGTNNIPSEILARWKKPIVSGALGQLMAMADKPWSNAGAAKYNNDVHAIAKGQAVAQNTQKRFAGIKRFV